MYKKRLFNILVALAMVITVVFTVQEAIAKSNSLSQGRAIRGAKAIECASLPSHYSLHTEVVEETGTWLPHTEDGPTGIDGGLINLLSNYRTCSK
jgi:hypothetical protein